MVYRAVSLAGSQTQRTYLDGASLRRRLLPAAPGIFSKAYFSGPLILLLCSIFFLLPTSASLIPLLILSCSVILSGLPWISGKVLPFRSRRCRRLRRFSTSPLPYPSQIGVYLRGCQPRSSQIGVEFSESGQIGVGLSRVKPRGVNSPRLNLSS